MTRWGARTASHAVIVLITLCFLGPFVWVLLSSVQPGSSPAAELSFSFSLANFRAVLNWDTVYGPLLNSVVISGSTALLTVVVSGLAAYPLSRYRLRYKRHFMLTLLFSTGLPLTAIMVPVYAMFFRFQLYGSVAAMVLFLTASALPFAIWMMKNFMDGVPVSLEEAAWVDGAGWVQSLRRVVAPLMAPGVAVVAIFVFVGQWGNFFVPFVLLDTPEKQCGRGHHLLVLLSVRPGGVRAAGGLLRHLHDPGRPALRPRQQVPLRLVQHGRIGEG